MEQLNTLLELDIEKTIRKLLDSQIRNFYTSCQMDEIGRWSMGETDRVSELT